MSPAWFSDAVWSVGMHTLNGDLSRLVQSGMINRQMAYKYSNDVAELDQYL